MIKSYLVVCVFVLLALPSIGQINEWVKRPKDEWPLISMINEVWYSNGERYVHPSFEYAATGFLIDTGTDTVAATVKHALWVAKMKSMNTVDLRGLRRWVMHPKGNLKDSVVIDYLVNTDTTEILNGPQSSITQRDWLVFTTQYRSAAIHPLKPRYSKVERGERIYFTGCPYSEQKCLFGEAQVLETEGNRIIFTMPEKFNVGGFSGSPLIDKDGYLIGILGGSSFDRKTGKPALYAISTKYLGAVLSKQQPLNVALVPIDVHITRIINEDGFKAGIHELRKLIETDSAYFTFDFSMENIAKIGDKLMQNGKHREAIKVYQLNKERYTATSPYLKLAQAYAMSGENKLARKTYQQILTLWPDNKEAETKLTKLE